MDLDTTIQGIELTHEIIQIMFNKICNIYIEDNISFIVIRTSDIREKDNYPGIRVSLFAVYQPLRVSLSVDVTTGDKITPHEIDYTFNLLFDNKSITILAYNLETILAEKIETILTRNIANTRFRDFYDIYILYKLRESECDITILKNALNVTCIKRGSLFVLSEYKSIVNEIQLNTEMNNSWLDYQKHYKYVKNIEFVDACIALLKIMEKIT